MRPSPAETRSLALLRTLALKKGFDVERSTMKGSWRLIDRDLKPARSPKGALAFTLAEAKTYLLTLPDA